jgi:hypothetical protein
LIAEATRKGLDAHVDEAVDGRHCIHGVQGRQHQVTRQRRLHGNLRGLGVADFADQNHVGILAQGAPEPVGEGEPAGLRAPASG